MKERERGERRERERGERCVCVVELYTYDAATDVLSLCVCLRKKLDTRLRAAAAVTK